MKGKSRLIKRHSRKFVAVFLVILLSIVLLPQSTLAQGHKLQILGEEISVQPDEENQNKLVSIITLSNNGPTISNLVFKAISLDGKDIQVSVIKGGTSIEGYSVAQFTIEFPDEIEETVTGHLIVEAPNVEPAIQSLTLEPGQPGADNEINILGIVALDSSQILVTSFKVGFVGLFAATLITLLIESSFNFKEVFKTRLVKELGWKFTENWLSSFVLVGGLFASFTASSMMPESTEIIGVEGFTALSFLFPLLIIISPFVVRGLESLGSGWAHEEDKTRRIHVLPFLAGSSIVIWAVTGQLAALGILFEELKIAGTFTDNVAQNGQIFLLILWLLGVFYAWENMVGYSGGIKVKKSAKGGRGHRFAGSTSYLP